MFVLVIGTLLYPLWELWNTAARNGNILQYPAELASFDPGTLAELLTLRGKSFHFNTVTFATIGYGHLQPLGGPKQSPRSNRSLAPY